MRVAEQLPTVNWSEAKCLGVTELMHPERGQTFQVNEAKAVCRGCPIKWSCLHYALESNEEIGIWGGMGSTERRRLKRRIAKGEVELRNDGLHFDIKG